MFIRASESPFFARSVGELFDQLQHDNWANNMFSCVGLSSAGMVSERNASSSRSMTMMQEETKAVVEKMHSLITRLSSRGVTKADSNAIIRYANGAISPKEKTKESAQVKVLADSARNESWDPSYYCGRRRKLMDQNEWQLLLPWRRLVAQQLPCHFFNQCHLQRTFSLAV